MAILKVALVLFISTLLTIGGMLLFDMIQESLFIQYRKYKDASTYNVKDNISLSLDTVIVSYRAHPSRWFFDSNFFYNGQTKVLYFMHEGKAIIVLLNKEDYKRFLQLIREEKERANNKRKAEIYQSLLNDIEKAKKEAEQEVEKAKAESEKLMRKMENEVMD